MKKHSYLTKTLSVFLSLLMVMTSVVVGNPLGLGLEASAAAPADGGGIKVIFASSAADTTRIDRAMLKEKGGFSGTPHLRIVAGTAAATVTSVTCSNSAVTVTGGSTSYSLSANGGYHAYKLTAATSLTESTVLDFTIKYTVGGVAQTAHAYLYAEKASYHPYHWNAETYAIGGGTLYIDQWVEEGGTAAKAWNPTGLNGYFTINKKTTADKFNSGMQASSDSSGDVIHDYGTCSSCHPGSSNEDGYAKSDSHYATYNYYIDTGLYPTWESSGLRIRYGNRTDNTSSYFRLLRVRLAIDPVYAAKQDGFKVKINKAPSGSGTFPKTVSSPTSGTSVTNISYSGDGVDERIFGKEKTSEEAYFTFSGNIPKNVENAKMMFSLRGEGHDFALGEAVTMTTHINLTTYDKTALRTLVSEHEDKAIVPSIHVAKRVDAYYRAMNNAKYVLGNEVLTQDKIDEAILRVQSTFSELDADTNIDLDGVNPPTDVHSGLSIEVVTALGYPVTRVMKNSAGTGFYAVYYATKSGNNYTTKDNYTTSQYFFVKAENHSTAPINITQITVDGTGYYIGGSSSASSTAPIGTSNSASDGYTVQSGETVYFKITPSGNTISQTNNQAVTATYTMDAFTAVSGVSNEQTASTYFRVVNYLSQTNSTYFNGGNDFDIVSYQMFHDPSGGDNQTYSGIKVSASLPTLATSSTSNNPGNISRVFYKSGISGNINQDGTAKSNSVTGFTGYYSSPEITKTFIGSDDFESTKSKFYVTDRGAYELNRDGVVSFKINTAKYKSTLNSAKITFKYGFPGSYTLANDPNENNVIIVGETDAGNWGMRAFKESGNNGLYFSQHTWTNNKSNLKTVLTNGNTFPVLRPLAVRLPSDSKFTKESMKTDLAKINSYGLSFIPWDKHYADGSNTYLSSSSAIAALPYKTILDAGYDKDSITTATQKVELTQYFCGTSANYDGSTCAGATVTINLYTYDASDLATLYNKCNNTAFVSGKYASGIWTDYQDALKYAARLLGAYSEYQKNYAAAYYRLEAVYDALLSQTSEKVTYTFKTSATAADTTRTNVDLYAANVYAVDHNLYSGRGVDGIPDSTDTRYYFVKHGNSYTVPKIYTVSSPSLRINAINSKSTDGLGYNNVSGNVTNVKAEALATGDRYFEQNYYATQYTITFKNDDGSALCADKFYYQDTPSPSVAPQKKNAAAGYEYTLAGWSTSQGGAVVTLPKVTANRTYYAIFNSSLINYGLLFMNYNGSTQVSSANFTVESAKPIAPTTCSAAAPTKTGYSFTFDGWSKTPYNPDSPDTAKVNPGTTLSALESATYFAHYSRSPVNYTITYKLNGGTNNAANPASYTIESAAITLANPTRTGYTFAGWTEGNSIPAGSTGNKTFTATWTPKTDTGYKVEHYQQNLNGTDYTKVDTDTLTGTTGGKTAAAAKNYTGFTAQSFTQATIAADGSTVVRINYDRNSYTIKFVNDNGTTIKENSLKYGAAITAPADPTKTGYHFTGWNPAVPATVTGEATFTATYAPNTATPYTVEYYQQNLENDAYTKVETVSKTGTTGAEAVADAKSYTGFTQKDYAKQNIAADGKTVVKIYFDRNLYTVTFKNGSTTLETDTNVKYGATPTYNGTTPTKTQTAQYSYTFSGWSKTNGGAAETLPTVSENVTYYAAFTSTTRTYTVTFKNEDGTLLQSSEVAYGATPAYTGATPAKAATAQYTYTFKGWSPAISAVTGDATYTATYNSAVNKYTVKFVSDGKTISTGLYEYGKEVPVPTATKAATAEYTYTFKSWTPAITGNTVTVTGNQTYTAQFNQTKKSYTVTYNANGGAAVPAVTNAWGTVITLPTTTRAGYTLNGWSDGTATYAPGATYTTPVANVTLTAQWTANDNTPYKVEHYKAKLDGSYNTAADETENKTGTTDTDTAAQAKAYDGYTAGAVTQMTITGDGNTVVKIYYTRNSYTVTFDEAGGSAATDVNDVWGTKITLPSTAKTGHTFNGWSDGTATYAAGAKYEIPVGGKAFTAQWTANKYDVTVNYVDENGNTIKASKTEQAEYGTTYTADIPAIEGYTAPTSGNTLTVGLSNNVITLKYTAKTDTAYTVKHYKANLDGTFAVETESKEGTTGAQTAAVAKTYTGFTAGEITQKTITGDGNTVVEIYYARNSYTITYNAGEGKFSDGTATKTFTFKYEAPVSIAIDNPVPTAAGYVFDKWSADAPATMGSANITINAIYKPNPNVVYTVNHYQQNISGDGYTLADTESKTGTAFAETAAVAKTYTGFKTPTVEQATIAADGSTTVSIYYDRETYTVKFVNDDNSEISSEEYRYGATVTPPADPTKEATAQYSYTFKAWTPAVETATADVTYKATYTETLRSYTVSFKNGDTVLQSGEVAYGATPAYTGEIPTKAADNTYTYAFSGWSPEIKEVTGTAEYTAQFTPTYIDYTVKFVDHDGTELSSKSYHYGDEVTVPANPTRTGYTFAGWDKEVTTVNGNVTYTAEYTVNSYTMTYIGKDGSTVDTKDYNYGATIVDDVDAPEIAGYTFKEWSGMVDTMPAGDVTVTAEYTANTDTPYKVIHYTADIGGTGYTEYKTETLKGTTDTTATATATEIEGFTFDNTSTENVTSGNINGEGDLVLKLYYKRNTYTVKFVNEDGTTLQTDDVEYGATPAYNGETPAKAATAQYTYTFKGWDKEIVAVTGDVTYTATYNSTVNKYTVTFINGNETTSGTYDYGTSVDVPNPEKAETDKYTYTFTSWDPAITGNTVTVEGDATYTAQFDEVKKNYIVTFDEAGGSAVTDVEDVWGTEITLPSTTKNGYTLNGWSDGTDTYAAGAKYEIPVGGKTLTAQWEVVTYTVSYELGGGTNGDGNPATYTIESAEITLAAPTRTGYTFTGWTQGNTIPAGSTGDKTFTAEWEPIEYTITYELDGGTNSDENPTAYTVESENIILKNPTKAGYTFKEWTDENGAKIGSILKGSTGDKTLTASWTANTDTEYTVKHYQQNIVDDEYTLVEADTQTLHGTTDTQTNAAAKDYTGFTAGEITQKTITGDGETVVEIYYTRNSYTITYNAGEGKFADDEVTKIYTFKYDAEVSVNPGTPVADAAGYVFDKWSADAPEKMSAEDIVITASYRAATDTAYTVEHYQQNLDNDEYTLVTADTQTLYGTTGAQTEAEAKSYAGFTAQSFEQVVIAGNGGTVVKIYYTRNTDTAYTVKHYKENLDGTYNTEADEVDTPTGKTGAQTEAEAKSYAGFTAQSFEQAVIAGDGTTVVEIRYTRNTNTAYKVEHYKQNIDGSYNTEADEVDTLTGKTGAQAEAEVNVYEGFTSPVAVNEAIKGDGTTVVVIKYARNSYTLTYNDRDGNEIGTKSYKFEETIANNDVTAPTVAGYNFTGWENIPTTMPARDVTVTAKYEAADNHYTVKTNIENADGSYETTTETVSAKTDAEINHTFDDKENYEKVVSADNDTAVKADGSSMVSVTYNRKAFDVVYKIGETVIDTQSYKWGKTVSVGTDKTVPEKEGYSFAWDRSGDFTMPTEAVTINGNYTINTYVITVESGSEAATINAQYGANILDAIAAVSTEKEGHTFNGWYMDETQVTETDTMPANNITVTGKWTPNEYDVTVNYLDNSNNTIRESLTERAVYGTSYKAEIPEIAGYIAPTGEYTITVGTENNVINLVYAHGDHTAYKVEHYQQNLDNDEYTLVETETLYGETDTQTSATAKTYPGFTAQAFEQAVIAGDGSTVVEIRYTRNTDISYTVEYETADGTKLVADKTVDNQTMGANVTETAADIAGYTVDAETKTLTLAATGNVITFIYTANTDISYTVEYETADGTKLAEDKTVDNQTMGANVTENAADIAGYTVDAETKTLTLAATGNVITFIYTANTDISYTVEYETADGTKLAEDKTVDNQTMGANVTETAADIAGYTVDAETKTLTLAATGNVITFIYTPVENGTSYTVNYIYSEDDSAIKTPLTVTATAGDVVELADLEKEIGGYTFDHASAESITVKGDGTSEITLYYVIDETDNKYAISYDLNGGAFVEGAYTTTFTVRDEIIIPAAEKAGYHFTGWAVTSTGGNWPAVDETIGAGNIGTGRYANVSLKACWTADTDVKYTVVYHYGESATSSTEKYGTAGSEITLVPENEVTFGDTVYVLSDYDKNLTIAGDGSTVLNVYYVVKTYTVTFKYLTDGSASATIVADAVAHGTNVADIADIADITFSYSDGDYDYEFTGWDKTDTVTSDCEINALYATGLFIEADYFVFDEQETIAEGIKANNDLKQEVIDKLNELIADGYDNGNNYGRTNQTIVDDAAEALKNYIDSLKDSEGNIIDTYLNKYTVVFNYKNSDGTDTSVTRADLVKGEAVEIPATPGFEVKAEGTDKTYKFTGWDSEVELTVSGDATYTATYKIVEYNDYNDIIDDITGSDIDDEIKEQIKNITDPIDDKKGDGTDDTNTQDEIIKAVDDIKKIVDKDNDGIIDEDILKKYTIKFMNGSDEIVTYELTKGSTPAYGELNPTKAQNGNIVYKFKGWDPAVTVVTGDQTYLAVFDEIDYTNYEKIKDELDKDGDGDLGDENLDDEILDKIKEIEDNKGTDDQDKVDERTNSLDDLINSLKVTITFRYRNLRDEKVVTNEYIKGATVVIPSEADTNYTFMGFEYKAISWTPAVETTANADATYVAVYNEPYNLDEAINKIDDAKGNIDKVSEENGDKIKDIIDKIENLFDEKNIVIDDNGEVINNPVDSTDDEFDKKLKDLLDGLDKIFEDPDVIICPTGHSYVQVEKEDATCTTVGHNAYKVCTKCNTKIGYVEYPSLGHDMKTVAGKAPTCTTDGHSEYKVCQRCGVKEGYLYLPALGHGEYNYNGAKSGGLSDGTVVWTAYSCSRNCGDTYYMITVSAIDESGKAIEGATVTITDSNGTVTGKTGKDGKFSPDNHYRSTDVLTISISGTDSNGNNATVTGKVTIGDGTGSGSLGYIKPEKPHQPSNPSGPSAFRCKMCPTYEKWISVPVVGWFVAFVHIFVHYFTQIGWLT